MEPMISVVVPVYNVEPYLERCFESLAAQTWRELEVIAVDDASTDGSGRLCDRWAEGDPRFRVVHFPENRGPSAARNEGIRQARGAYLSFVDADDYVEAGLLQGLYHRLQETGADVSVCGAEGIRIKDGPPGGFFPGGGGPLPCPQPALWLCAPGKAVPGRPGKGLPL